MSLSTSSLTDLKYDKTIRAVTSEIWKLLYRFWFRLLDCYYEGTPPVLFNCIGFNFVS